MIEYEYNVECAAKFRHFEKIRINMRKFLNLRLVSILAVNKFFPIETAVSIHFEEKHCTNKRVRKQRRHIMTFRILQRLLIYQCVCLRVFAGFFAITSLEQHIN